jgi:hypothetical protein
MVTFAARIPMSQWMFCASMTVLSVVMVHGPVYSVSVVPGGTPVLLGPGYALGVGASAFASSVFASDGDEMSAPSVAATSVEAPDPLQPSVPATTHPMKTRRERG